MNRNRNDVNKNKGFYIAASCCVLAIAIVGYVSRFVGNQKHESQNSTEISYNENSKTQEISEINKLPIKEETKKTEPKTVPAETKTEPVAKNVIAEDNIPELSKPVQGKVIAEFSGESLVFNELLGDWRSHNGVDFKADAGEKVVACADGVIEDAGSGSMGEFVIIDHENGLKSVYANLAELKNENMIGKNIKKGEVIGEVGNSALIDFSKESHLHFEVLKDENYTNPMEYFE